MNETLEDITYLKEFECPVCYNKIKSRVIKTGRNKFIESSLDLRAKYEVVDPTLYDVIHCDCGYTAISKTFGKVSSVQRNLIKEGICSRYVKREFSSIRTIEDAITLYKLALLNAQVKRAGTGEIGLICLKLYWLHRDLNNQEEATRFLKFAADNIEDSISVGSLVGLDDDTAIYTIAALRNNLGEYDKALKLLGEIITSNTASSKLKEKALDLKEDIKGHK